MASRRSDSDTGTGLGHGADPTVGAKNSTAPAHQIDHHPEWLDESPVDEGFTIAKRRRRRQPPKATDREEAAAKRQRGKTSTDTCHGQQGAKTEKIEKAGNMEKTESQDGGNAALPPSLAALERTFAALATVHTFLRVRGELHCTLEQLQRPVSNLLPSDECGLTLREAVKMETVAPGLVHLSRVRQWEVDVEGSFVSSHSGSLSANNAEEDDATVVVVEFLDGGEMTARQNEKHRSVHHVTDPPSDRQDQPPTDDPHRSESIKSKSKSKKPRGRKLDVPLLIERRKQAFKAHLMEFARLCQQNV